MKYTSIIFAAALLAVSSFAQPISIRSNSYDVTVSSKGIANGQSLIVNNGAMFGPDTPGTVTTGLAEAFSFTSAVGNYGPLAGGIAIQLVDNAYYFYTNALVFSNLYPTGFRLLGKDSLSTKLVYAGTRSNICTIMLTSGSSPSAGINASRFGSYVIRDLGFSAINNTTNILLCVSNYASFEGINLNFTSWQLMTNQIQGATVSIFNNVHATDGLPVPGLVGLKFSGGGDHGTVLMDIFLAGLADGIDAGADHLTVYGVRSAFVGEQWTLAGSKVYTNMWRRGSGSPYALGAVILRRGGLDSVWNGLHIYEADAGYCQIDSTETALLIHPNFESVQFNAASDFYGPTVFEGATTVKQINGPNSAFTVQANYAIAGGNNPYGVRYYTDQNAFGGSSPSYTIDGGAGNGIGVYPDGSVDVLSNLTVLTGRYIGNGSGLTNITPVITNFTTYAVGTAYTLTGTSAALDFGTTDPVLTINQAGTYLITANVGVKYSGATYVAAQTISLKFRRTNNTAADLSNGSRTVELPVLTTFTGGDTMALPSVIYTATSGDTVTIFGILSATPSAGSVQADSAELVAIRLY